MAVIVPVRMLENQFITYRTMHEHFLQHFLIPSIARFMGWREVSVHMKEFKMADDMQLKQLLLSMNQMKKVSDKTLLSEFGKDALDESRLIEQELRRNLEIQKLDSLYKAQIQGESQQVLTKFQLKSQEAQMKAQQKMQERMGGQPGGGDPAQADPSAVQQAAQGGAPTEQGGERVNVIELAEAYAKRLGGMDPEQQNAVLGKMQEQMPQLHDLVQQKLQVMKSLEMQPLPEHRPPRRDAALI